MYKLHIQNLLPLNTMNVNNKWQSFQYVFMDNICAVTSLVSIGFAHPDSTSVEQWVRSRDRDVISCSWSHDSISQLSSSSSSMASSKQWVSSVLSYCRFMFLAIIAKQLIHKRVQSCFVFLRMRGAPCLTCRYVFSVSVRSFAEICVFCLLLFVFLILFLRINWFWVVYAYKNVL